MGLGLLCCVPDETEWVGYGRRDPRSRCFGGAGRTGELVARSVQSPPIDSGRTGTGRGAKARGFGCGTFGEHATSVVDATGARKNRRTTCGRSGGRGRRAAICPAALASVGRSVASDERRGRPGLLGLLGRPLGKSRNATWLILPVVICLSQRLSHACVSMNEFRL